MPDAISEVLLWLFVINLGIAFGAGLYESRIVVTQWTGSWPGSVHRWDAEAARHDDTGRRFWVFVTTVPLTLFTVANLVAALRAQGAVRGWWLGAAVAALAERLFTFSYFIPTMVRLTGAVDSPESRAKATRWARLNYVRHGIVLVAWLAALRAFALAYAYGAAGRTP